MKVPREALIYSRDPLIIFIFSLRGFKALYDAHNYPTTKVRLFEFLLCKVSGVIANSRGTASMFPGKKVLVAPNGVDLNEFEAASHVGVENGTVLYSGHLYSWKGVDTVLSAAALCPHLKFMFVGGTADDLLVYRKKQQELGLNNVFFEGHIPKTQIPARLLRASVVLLPNNPGSIESEKYTSPIKMFEYMASGVPLVASDLPSLREVLDESMCTFFKAGDSEDLARALKLVLAEYPGAQAKAVNAKRAVRQYSWDSRAGRILDFIRTEICVE
jgi:glycosyltransferase involved in cell wall biosynthesis